MYRALLGVCTKPIPLRFTTLKLSNVKPFSSSTLAPRRPISTTQSRKQRPRAPRPDQTPAKQEASMSNLPIGQAALLLIEETNASRGMEIVKAILSSNQAPGAPFFQSALDMCKRLAPANALTIIRKAVAHNAVDEPVFCTFIACCQASKPPLHEAAVEFYQSCAPRTRNVFTKMLSFLHVIKQHNKAVPIIKDMLDADIMIPEDLLGLSIIICRDANSTMGADCAAALLSTLQSKRLVPSYDHCLRLLRVFFFQDRFDDAGRLLQLMNEFGVPLGPPFWNTAITDATSAGALARAVKIVDFMQARSIPLTADIYFALFRAVEVSSQPVPAVISLLDRITADPELMRDDRICTNAIPALSSCGRLDLAVELFKTRVSRSPPPPTPYCYNAMISSYIVHEKLTEALGVLEEMVAQSVTPNIATLTVFLKYLSRSGDVEKATQILTRLSALGVPVLPVHIECMINVYAKAGKLEEAEAFVRGQPNSTAGTWASLLAACYKRNDLSRSERIFQELAARNDPEASPITIATIHVIMARIYAANGLKAQQRQVYETLKAKAINIHTFAAPTWLQLPRVALRFHPNDPRLHKNFALSQRHSLLINELTAHGYTPDLSCVYTSRASDTEKRDLLFKRSEKVAIAFALLRTAATDPIILNQAPRVSSDSHAAAKVASAVYRREIVITDATSEHHFTNGKCSCGDSW